MYYLPSLSQGTDNFCTYQSRGTVLIKVEKTMINHNEYDLNLLDIKSGLHDSQSNAQPIALTRWLQLKRFIFNIPNVIPRFNHAKICHHKSCLKFLALILFSMPTCILSLTRLYCCWVLIWEYWNPSKY
jgi:hypothetical protein